MTQPPSVHADLTVAANVRYFARMVNVPTSEALAVLPTVDLDEYRDLIVGTLSEGERSRVSLLGTPELLVLDDPTVGLAATHSASPAIPNFLITEYFFNMDSLGNENADQPFEVVNSEIAVPERPGLGIEFDEAAMARFPYEQFPARRIATVPHQAPSQSSGTPLVASPRFTGECNS